MGKTKKIQQCYQSTSGSRPPKCNQSPAHLCASCCTAMSFYNQVKATKHRLSKMKKEDRFSGLLANNLALTMEYEELVKHLGDMNAAKDAIKDAISAKVQEIGAIPFTKTT